MVVTSAGGELPAPKSLADDNNVAGIVDQLESALARLDECKASCEAAAYVQMAIDTLNATHATIP